MKTGKQLRKWRRDKELTLQDVSDLIGCSVGFLSRLEREERNNEYYLEQYSKLAEEMGE